MKKIKDINDVNISISLKDANTRYKLGEKSDDFSTIKEIEPVFSFRYVCLDVDSKFSLDSKYIRGIRDYHKLIKALRDKSNLTYGSMDADKNKHFHDIEWKDVKIKESEFKKCISSQIPGKKEDVEIDVTPYQFKAYEGARIIGFIYKTVFYVVMLDREHNAYKRK